MLVCKLMIYGSAFFFWPNWERVRYLSDWEFLHREIDQIRNFRVVKSVKLGNIENLTNLSTGNFINIKQCLYIIPMVFWDMCKALDWVASTKLKDPNYWMDSVAAIQLKNCWGGIKPHYTITSCGNLRFVQKEKKM